MLDSLVHGIDRGIRALSETFYGPVGSYCMLETVDRGALVADDGSLLSVLRLEGALKQVGVEEYTTIVNGLTEKLQSTLSRPGHSIQIVFEYDPEASGERIREMLLPSRRTAQNLGLHIGPLLENWGTALQRYCSHVAAHAPTLPEDVAAWAKSQWQEAGGSGTPPGLVNGKMSEAGLFKLLSQMRLGNPNWFNQVTSATEAGLLREMVMMQAIQLELTRKNNELLDRMLRRCAFILCCLAVAGCAGKKPVQDPTSPADVVAVTLGDAAQTAHGELAMTTIERNDFVERFIACTGIPVEHHGGTAFYEPGSDVVKMPFPERFTVPEEYYATKLHGSLSGEYLPRQGTRAGWIFA